MSAQRKNPYLGPRTFEERHAQLFFGREKEALDLLSTVISEPLTLFYAPSGSGKSSLINTRLVPGLKEEGFHVLPKGRLAGSEALDQSRADNICVYNLLLSLDQGTTPAEELRHLSLPAYLARARQALDDPEATLVLIIDQFEEIITRYQAYWQHRQVFFEQLFDALAADRLLWVVLSFREDYLAAIEPYADGRLGQLSARYRMLRMRYTAALAAIKYPAADHGRPYAPGVAERLVDNLRQIRTHGAEGTGRGEFVEPVQLQVVCYQLWENLKHGQLAEITAADVERLGDVDQALGDFYQRTIVDILAGADPDQLTELDLRNWFERQLITEQHTRGTVFQGPEETAGLPNEVVRQLADHYLLRSELRAGGAWYELVHDRLVSPILQSNAAWRESQGPVLLAAEAWQQAGRPDEGLYEGSQLKEALTALDEETAQPLVSEFLVTSQAVQEQKNLERARQLDEARAEAERQKERAEEQARTSRRLTLLASILLLVLVAAIVLGAFAATQSVRAGRLNDSYGTAQAANEVAATANADLVQAVANLSSAGEEEVAAARSTANAAAMAADVARATAESANLNANATAASRATAGAPATATRPPASGDLDYQVVSFDRGIQTDRVKPGETFSATWTIRNTSSIAWPGDFQFVYVDREVAQTDDLARDRMADQGAYTLEALTGRDAFEPGEQLALTLKMTAPVSPDMYASHWEMRDQAGSPFGGTRWMVIQVEDEAPVPDRAVILDVPYRSQSADDAVTHISDDGPAALAMMLNAAGIDISVDGVYDYLPPKERREFTSIGELLRASAAIGVDASFSTAVDEAQAIVALLEAIDDGRPFIALVNYPLWADLTESTVSSGHFVLVVGYDQDHVYVHDSLLGTDETPFRGAYFKLPTDLFLDGWGGFAGSSNYQAIFPDVSVAEPLASDSDIYKATGLEPKATRLLDVPYRSQWADDAVTHTADGGPTAVTMLLNAAGVDITPDELHRDMPPVARRGFATPNNMIQGAAANGLELEEVTSSGAQEALARLRVSVDEGKPFLALVNYEPWRDLTGNQEIDNAYVLVVGFESDSVTIHDPYFGLEQPAADGAYLEIPLALFLEAWGGFEFGVNNNWSGIYPKDPVLQP